MKNRILVWMLMLWGLYSCESPIADVADRNFSDTLQVGTYNVRISTCLDDYHRSWCFRRNYIALQLYTHAFDLIGLQELQGVDQERDLHRLMPDYDFYSKGNGDAAGVTGQRLAVAFDRKRFAVLDTGFFFLSEIPGIPSLAWDAESVHLCLWMKLRDNQSGQYFYFFNTHLSWCGKEARKQSVRLILGQIAEKAGDLPVFLAGDLNAPPTDTSIYVPLAVAMADSRVVSESPPGGYEGTFNNWEPWPWNFTEKRRFDYVFVRNVRVVRYQALNEQFVDDCWPSDHFPILLSVLL